MYEHIKDRPIRRDILRIESGEFIPYYDAEDALKRAHTALNEALGENEKLKEAHRKAFFDSGYCYVCDKHDGQCSACKGGLK